MLFMPTLVLFFQENGLSMTQVLLLQSVFSIAIVALEVPSGYVSDVLGRKKTIIMAVFSALLGYVTYSIGFNFWTFLIAELLLAIAGSLMSGTDSALLYDSLLQHKKEKDYKKVEGKVQTITSFSEGTAAIIGGFLAVLSLRTPIIIYTILLLAVIPIAFSIKEPSRKKYVAESNPLVEIAKIMKYSVHKNKAIRYFILYAAIINAGTLTLVWFAQPFLQETGLNIKYFGVVWAIANFSVGIFSWQADKYENFFGRKKSLISLVIILVTGYILVASFQQIWAIIFLLPFYFVRGISNPILKDYINNLVSSDIRATVLSVKNLGARLLFAIIGPIIGLITDTFTLQIAFMSSAIIFSTLGIFSLLMLKVTDLL